MVQLTRLFAAGAALLVTAQAASLTQVTNFGANTS